MWKKKRIEPTKSSNLVQVYPYFVTFLTNDSNGVTAMNSTFLLQTKPVETMEDVNAMIAALKRHDPSATLQDWKPLKSTFMKPTLNYGFGKNRISIIPDKPAQTNQPDETSPDQSLGDIEPV